MLTRRAALKGGTATVAAIASAGAVAARVAVDEPLIQLERQWRARLDATHDLPDEMPEEERQPYYDAVSGVEVEIRETPAQSVSGLCVKLRLYAHYKGLFNRPEWWGLDWTDELAKAALLDAERLAGRAQS